MSTSKNTIERPTKARCARRFRKTHGGLNDPLSSWRTLQAPDFSSRDVHLMREALAKTALLGQPKWAGAVSGDAPAAVAVAISLMPVATITLSLDLAMTALIACAIEGDPGAVIVASNILRNLPGMTTSHHRIATSWFVSNLATRTKSRGAAKQAAPLAIEAVGIPRSKLKDTVPKPHQFWRTIQANEYTESHHLAVANFINKSVPRINAKLWMGAIAGDALCAIRLAGEISHENIQYTRLLDVRMTLLLNCALNGNADAALALASQLERMPIESKTQARLVASWLIRGRQLEDMLEPEIATRHQPAATLVTDREDAS